MKEMGKKNKRFLELNPKAGSEISGEFYRKRRKSTRDKIGVQPTTLIKKDARVIIKRIRDNQYGKR